MDILCSHEAADIGTRLSSELEVFPPKHGANFLPGFLERENAPMLNVKQRAIDKAVALASVHRSGHRRYPKIDAMPISYLDSQRRIVVKAVAELDFSFSRRILLGGLKQGDTLSIEATTNTRHVDESPTALAEICLRPHSSG